MRKLYIIILIVFLMSPSNAILRKFSDFTERWYQGYDDTTKGMTNEPTNNYFGINKIKPTCSLDVSGDIKANTINITNLEATNLEATNLESDLDGTGYDLTITDISSNGTITANKFAGDVNCGYVQIDTLDPATYTTQCEFNSLFGSAGQTTGGIITDTGSETMAVSAGSGFIKATDSDTATLNAFDWVASSNISIPTDTTRYIGIEYVDEDNAPIVCIKDTQDWDLDTTFPLGSVINLNGVLYILNNPWWITDGITNLIEKSVGLGGYLARDNNVGGLTLGVTATRYPTMTPGTVWGRTNEFEMTAIDYSPTPSGTFNTYWLESDGTVHETTGNVQYPVTQWNDIDNDTLENLLPNKYANWWVFINLTNNELSFIYPSAYFSSAAAAEAESVPSTIPGDWYLEGTLIGRIVFKTSTDIPIEVQSVFETTFTAALAADHGNLTGLSDDDHPQYILADGTRAFTGEQSFTSIDASGTVTASFFVGDGSGITGIQSEGVVTDNYFPALVLNNVANIFYGDGSNLTGISSEGTSSGGSGDIMSSLAVVAEARKRGSDISLPLTNIITEAAESSKPTIPLYSDYTSGATTINLTNKIIIEDGNYIPIYLTDDATGTYDEIWLKDLSSEATGQYIYNLVASANNSYTTANAAYLSNSTGMMSNNTIQYNSDALGDDSTDTPFNSETNLFGYVDKEALVTANMDAYTRFYSPSYTVSSLNSYISSDQIQIAVDSDISPNFKDNDYIAIASVLKEDNDEVTSIYKKLKQYSGDNSISWDMFRLSADSTYSSPNLTLTVDTALSHITGAWTSILPSLATENMYSLLRVPDFKYVAGAKTLSAFTQTTPSEFLVNGGNQLMFEDDFNRTDGTLSDNNNWSLSADYTVGSPTGWAISTLEAYINGNDSSIIRSRMYRNYEKYDFENKGCELTVKFKWVYTNGVGNDAHLTFSVNSANSSFGSSTTSVFNGMSIVISPKDQLIYFYIGNTLVATSSAVTITSGTYYNIKFIINGGKMYFRFWDVADDEPTVWELTHEITTYQNDGDYLSMVGYSYANGNQSSDFYVDDIAVKNITEGYTLKYGIESLSNVEKYGVKCIAPVRVTSDVMEIYEIGCGLIEQ